MLKILSTESPGPSLVSSIGSTERQKLSASGPSSMCSTAGEGTSGALLNVENATLTALADAVVLVSQAFTASRSMCTKPNLFVESSYGTP